MTYYALPLFASTYGSGSYDSASYSGTATSSGGSSGSGGSLTDTGIAVVSIITVAAIILLAAMVVRIWKRPAKQVAAVTPDDEPDNPEPVNR